MTNNPTIGGVSRQRQRFEKFYLDRAERFHPDLSRRGDHPEAEYQNPAIQGDWEIWQGRALIDAAPHEHEWDINAEGTATVCYCGARSSDAPAVERQEPIGELEIYGYQCRQSEQEKFFLCEYPQFWQHIALVRKDDAEAQTSAQQSTIARLEARITQLESEKEFAAATYQAARDRIAEMESGRGEPVAWSVHWKDTGEAYLMTRKRERMSRLADDPDFKVIPLYVALPASGQSDKYDDVLMPFLALMRAELHANAHKGDRPGWLQMDSKTAILEVFYHLGKLHQAVHRGEEAAIKEYAADVANMCMILLDVCACLDATAALNGPAK